VDHKINITITETTLFAGANDGCLDTHVTHIARGMA